MAPISCRASRERAQTDGGGLVEALFLERIEVGLFARQQLETFYAGCHGGENRRPATDRVQATELRLLDIAGAGLPSLVEFPYVVFEVKVRLRGEPDARVNY